MKIPLLDLKAQYISIKEEIDLALNRVLDSQYFVLSEEVSSLEEEVARYSGAVYGAGVASGTDALILALRAGGVGAGDLVITTPFTFFATAEAISVLGAAPVFVDIDPDTYNIDPKKLEEFLGKCDGRTLERTKGILPVHIYGQCADMDAINGLADKYGLAVYEDCAQAIGAKYKGRPAGSMSTAGCFSFFPSKNLGGFGDGGMITSSDKEFIDRVKRLRVHGSSEQYIHEEIGYNSRLDSLQAAILRVKLKHLEGWIKKRRSNALKYDEAFNAAGIKTPVTGEGNEHTYHQYTIFVDRRNEMLEYLKNRGIAARVYYPVPMHLQPCYKDLDYSIGSLPVSERSCEQVLSLPVYPELTEEQLGYIIDTVADFAKRQ